MSSVDQYGVDLADRAAADGVVVPAVHVHRRLESLDPPPWCLDALHGVLRSAEGDVLIDLHSIHTPLDVVRVLEELLQLRAPDPLVAIGAVVRIYTSAELGRPGGRLDRASQDALLERAALHGPPPRRRRGISAGTRHVHRVAVP